MDETQLLPCTQLLLDDSCDNGKETFVNGWLEIAGQKHDLVLGENKIGRDPDTCQVLLQNAPGVSKEHAMLEVEEGCATLMDLASRNKTRMGKLVLRPHVRYALHGGERLVFGNMSATYKTNDDDSSDGKEAEAIKESTAKRHLSSQPTSSLGSTPDIAEELGSSISPLQTKTGSAKVNSCGNSQTEEQNSCDSKQSGDASLEEEKSSKANTSFEMLTADKVPNSPMLELKRSNSRSPFRSGSQDSKYARKCFFMPTQAKTVVEDSDEEVHSDANEDDIDLDDDSIISPTPHPRFSVMLSGTGALSQSSVNKIASTPITATKVKGNLAIIPETPCTPSGRPETAGNTSDVSSSPRPGSRSADFQEPQASTSAASQSLIGDHLVDGDAECYNSDVSTDVESDGQDAEEGNVSSGPNKKNSEGNERNTSLGDVDKKANISAKDNTIGDLHQESTQVFSEKTCVGFENKGIAFADTTPPATQDVLEAFGEVPTEFSDHAADETNEILAAFEESPRKVNDGTFKKPFSTPASGRKSKKNSRDSSLDSSAMTQDILDQFECPTQVVAEKSPRLAIYSSSDDELSLAPTQLFVGDEKDLSEKPTQVFIPESDPISHSDSISDMCTQIYREDVEVNAYQKQDVTTPVTRSKVGPPTPDGFKSPAHKAINITEVDSPSCLPTQIYNEGLNSPRRELNESISDMATQPYHADLEVEHNLSSRSCTSPNAESTIDDLATQLVVCDQADDVPLPEAEATDNFAKPWSVDGKKNDCLSEMATQLFVADDVLESRPEVPVGDVVDSPSAGGTCGDDLSDMATQPYSEFISEKRKSGLSTGTELPADFEESISNIPTQPYVEREADHDEPEDIDATQIFDASETANSSKMLVEAPDEDFDENYDAPTQNLLNCGDEVSPAFEDLPTLIIPTDDQDSTGKITDKCKDSTRDDDTLTPTLNIPGPSEKFPDASSNAAIDTNDNTVRTDNTPLKLPENNDDIALTASLNPLAQRSNAGNSTTDFKPNTCNDYHEDQDTDSCNSSTVSDTMLACLTEEIDDKCLDLNSEDPPTPASSPQVALTETLEASSSSPVRAGTVTSTDDITCNSEVSPPNPEEIFGGPSATPDAEFKTSEDKSQAPHDKSGEDDTEASTTDAKTLRSDKTRTPNVKTRTRGAKTRASDAETCTSDIKTRTRGAKIRTPDAETRTPDAETRTPDAKTRTPDAKTRTPDAKTRTRGAKIRTPDAETSTPDSKTRTPDSKTRTPDSKTCTPDARTRTPDAKTCTPDAKTRTPDAKTRTPDAKTCTPDAETSTPDAKTSVSDAKTRTRGSKTRTPDGETLASDAKASPEMATTSVEGEDARRSDCCGKKPMLTSETVTPSTRTGSSNAKQEPEITNTNASKDKIEEKVPGNSFHFGANQYGMADLDSDDNDFNESIGTLNFESDSESGNQSGRVTPALENVPLQAASTPRSHARTPCNDIIKTALKDSKRKSARFLQSQGSPRHSTLRKKKNFNEKFENAHILSSDDDSELDCSSQPLFNVSINKIAALKLFDHDFRSSSASDSISPVAQSTSKNLPSTTACDAEELVGKQSSSNTKKDVNNTIKSKSSIVSGGTSEASAKNNTELPSVIPESSNSDDKPRRTSRSAEKSEISHESTRASRKKCRDTSSKTHRKSSRVKIQSSQESREVFVEESSNETSVSGKRKSPRSDSKHSNSGSSGSVNRHAKSIEVSTAKEATSEVISASSHKQTNDHSNSTQDRSVADEENVASSNRSTRSGRTQRRPLRYSPDEKNSGGRTGLEIENSKDMRPTTSARKRGCPQKTTAKRMKSSDERDFSVDKESAENHSITNKECSSSGLPTTHVSESASSSSKTDTKCMSQTSVHASSSEKVEVNIEGDSDATVSSATDALPSDGGRGRSSRLKNRVSIETSTPSKPLSTRSTRSRASIAVPAPQTKTGQHRDSVTESVSEDSTSNKVNRKSQQPVASRSDCHVIDEVDKILHEKSASPRKSTRFSSRNLPRNSATKRGAKEDLCEETEACSDNKRIKVGESSHSSLVVPTNPVDQQTVTGLPLSSTSTSRNQGKNHKKSHDFTHTVDLENNNSDSATASTSVATSKKKNDEENRPSSKAQNSQSSFLVPVEAISKRSLRKNQDSAQQSQDSMEVVDLTEESSSSRRRTRDSVIPSRSSSKPTQGRGRPRNSRNLKAPATEADDLDSSVLSVESFASSVGRQRRDDTASQRSSGASERKKLLSELENTLLSSPSERQSRASMGPRVLFTGFVPEADHLKTLKRLGGLVVESATECSVLVSANAKRTCKLLACVARGVPVVGTAWLAASAVAAAFADPWEYIIKDTEMEKKCKFDMKKSLMKARCRPLFSGLSIHATPGVLPQPDDMRDLVVCGGGEYLDRPPRSFYAQIVVVSCQEDKKLWPAFRKLNIPVVSTEFILTGILRSEVSVKSHLLK